MPRFVRMAVGVGLILAASAQSYPLDRAAPPTTNRASLASLARAREVRERFALGLNALGRGENLRAEREFRAIVTLDPGEPNTSTAFYDLALAQAREGRNDDAVTSLNEALRRDRGFASAAANLVAVELRRGDLVRARAAADRFVAIAPRGARARYERGLVALRQGDSGAALADFRVLLELDPRYAVAHYDLAIAYIARADLAEAQRELELALNLAPAYARARFALGTVYLREGRRADARVAFERASHDTDDVTLRNLARSLLDQLPSG